MFLLNEVCYLKTSIAVIHFFYGSVIILRQHLKRSICQGHYVYFITLVATIHVVASGLWLIKEHLNDMPYMFIWGKLLQPCSFKGACLFHRTSCTNICLKTTVLNALKYLQPPHSLLVNVLICNFATVIATIH